MMLPNNQTSLDNHDIHIFQLKTAYEIKQVAHLRTQINLMAATMIDPYFFENEKKGMRLGWSSLLS